MNFDWLKGAETGAKALVAIVILVLAVVWVAVAARKTTPPTPEPYEVPVPVDSVRLTSQAPGEWWATELPDGTRCVTWYQGGAGGLACSFPAGPTWDEQVERGVRR